MMVIITTPFYYQFSQIDDLWYIPAWAKAKGVNSALASKHSMYRDTRPAGLSLTLASGVTLVSKISDMLSTVSVAKNHNYH